MNTLQDEIMLVNSINLLDNHEIVDQLTLRQKALLEVKLKLQLYVVRSAILLQDGMKDAERY